MGRRLRSLLLACAVLAIAGCGMQVEATFERVGSPDAGADQRSTSPVPLSFDVALVPSTFTAECQDPIVVDDIFCQQVKISEMTGTGKLLTVPTTLNATAGDRATAICNMLSIAHFEGDTGNDLGYSGVEVLDLAGDTAAACTVR